MCQIIFVVAKQPENDLLPNQLVRWGSSQNIITIANLPHVVREWVKMKSNFDSNLIIKKEESREIGKVDW